MQGRTPGRRGTGPASGSERELCRGSALVTRAGAAPQRRALHAKPSRPAAKPGSDGDSSAAFAGASVGVCVSLAGIAQQPLAVPPALPLTLPRGFTRSHVGQGSAGARRAPPRLSSRRSERLASRALGSGGMDRLGGGSGCPDCHRVRTPLQSGGMNWGLLASPGFLSQDFHDDLLPLSCCFKFLASQAFHSLDFLS